MESLSTKVLRDPVTLTSLEVAHCGPARVTHLLRMSHLASPSAHRWAGDGS